MYHHPGAERAPYALVDELDRAIEKLGRAGGVEGRFGAGADERLFFDPTRLALRIDVAHEGPRQRARRVLLRFAADEAAETLGGAGIIRFAARHAGEHRLDLVQKLLAIGPAAPSDDQLAGDAVERGVVDDHRRHVLGLKIQLAPAIRPRHDDP